MEDSLVQRILERKESGNIRGLMTTKDKVDFVSNDYLGLARNETLFQLINMHVGQAEQVNKNGSSGSRLLSGNSVAYELLEKYLAEVFISDSTLVFNSGYQANLAIVSSVPKKGDTILYDQLSHICLKEGAWLSKADSVMFAHNDLADLERKLKNAIGEKYVIIEAIYSMDGDYAPLHEMVSLCKKHDAKIILDEAHSTGVHGDEIHEGNGWAIEQKLQEDIFARVYTFGKGMGVHGACIAGSQVLKDYLVNFARPFIYTTALPLHSLVSIDQSFRYLAKHGDVKGQLNELINHFKVELKRTLVSQGEYYYLGSDTAIQPVIIPGNDRIKLIAAALHTEGFDIRPILSPTVKKNTERLRISLHVYNTKNEITRMLETLNRLL